MKDTMNQERKTIDSDGRRWLGPALSYLLAVFGLVWVFHDFHPAEFWRQVVGIDWWWVLPALVLDVLSYLSQGERWRRLLRPLGRISTLRTTQAIYAGLFINEILPMRVGEIGRAYLVSRWLERPFLAVVPSMAVERLMDAVWLRTCCRPETSWAWLFWPAPPCFYGWCSDGNAPSGLRNARRARCVDRSPPFSAGWARGSERSACPGTFSPPLVRPPWCWCSRRWRSG
jgi:hypothetical protein